MELKINNQLHVIDVEPDTPLLWVLRDQLGLTGTKFGCGMGLCGACTILMDGKAVLACITPLSIAIGKTIITIEGLANGPQLHPVQSAWIKEQVPQCGYCQSGQIMTAVGLLNSNAKPNDSQINKAMSGNLCRCGTYQRIKNAIHRASSNKG